MPRVGWVERLVRRSSMSEGGSDTHQLHFTDMMGFARAQPILRPLANIRSPDGAQRNPGLTRRRPRIARSLSSGGASRRPVGSSGLRRYFAVGLTSGGGAGLKF